MATVAARNVEYAVTFCKEISKTRNKYAKVAEKTIMNVNNIIKIWRRRTRLTHAEIKSGIVAVKMIPK